MLIDDTERPKEVPLRGHSEVFCAGLCITNPLREPHYSLAIAAIFI